MYTASQSGIPAWDGQIPKDFCMKLQKDADSILIIQAAGFRYPDIRGPLIITLLFSFILWDALLHISHAPCLHTS